MLEPAGCIDEAEGVYEEECVAKEQVVFPLQFPQAQSIPRSWVVMTKVPELEVA